MSLRKPGDVSWWLDHIEWLISDERQRDYVLDWMAYALQHPERKLNHHLLIGGEPGIGKDSLFQPFVRGVGSCNEVGEKAIASDYEDHLDDVKLVCVQEISSFIGKQELEDALKSQLASPPLKLLLNPKSRRKKEVPNLMNWIFYTNRLYPLNLSQNDRRMYCVWCNATQEEAIAKGDAWYFQCYYDQLDDGGDYAVVDWLLKRDVSRFNPAGQPPATTWKEEIMGMSGGRALVMLRELKASKAGPFQLALIRTQDVRDLVPELRDESHPVIAAALKELGCVHPDSRVAKKIDGKTVECRIYVTRDHERLRGLGGAELFDQYWRERLEVDPHPDEAAVPAAFRSVA